MKKKYSKELILNLRSENKTNKEIAEIVGSSRTCIERTLTESGISYYNPLTEIELSQTQKEVLYGTLIGDSCVRYVQEYCNYPMLSFSHTGKQKEYFFKKYKIFENILSKKPQIRKVITNFTSKEGTEVCSAVGRNMKCLIPVREMFYVDNKKILPMCNEFKDNFTEQSFYYLFMDDGCKDREGYILSTYCFDKENQEEFCKFLDNKFNIQCNIKKDLSLYIRRNSTDIVTDILNKYNDIESMNYKIQKSPH